MRRPGLTKSVPLVCFLLSYAGAGIVAAGILSQFDYKPLGSFVSLLIISGLSAVTTAIVALLTQFLSHRSFDKGAEHRLGAGCSVVSSLAIGAALLRIDFWISLTLAFLLPAALAMAAFFFIGKSSKSLVSSKKFSTE